MIIASSSPTIIQKESTDSGTSTLVNASAASSSPAGSAGNVGGAGSGPHAGIPAEQAAVAKQDTAESLAAAVDQTAYESVLRHQQQQPGSASVSLGQSNVLAVAMAAAQEPALINQQGLAAAGHLSLPTVATQMAPELGGAAAGAPGAGHSHAPLNATNTMKQAPSVVSSPRATVKPAPGAAGEFRWPTMSPGGASELQRKQ